MLPVYQPSTPRRTDIKPFYALITTTMLTGVLALQPAFAADEKAAPPVKAEAPAKPDMAMRPCRESTSFLSESSLTIMMVLEKVSATAT